MVRLGKVARSGVTSDEDLLVDFVVNDAVDVLVAAAAERYREQLLLAASGHLIPARRHCNHRL